jgi:SAM-dependent methyltransferase
MRVLSGFPMQINEINYTEIDVDQLMARIREVVERRGVDLSLTSQSSVSSVPGGGMSRSTLLLDLPIPPLSLSPEFQARTDGKYHVNDLLKYHDRDFVHHAYQAILKREPDEQGYLHNIEMLRNGHLNRIDVLASLCFSDEGQKHGVRIEGLRTPLLIRRLGRIPLLGYFVRLTVALVRLPASIQIQGQSEAQLQAVNDYLNQTSAWMAQHLQKHASALEELIGREGDTQEEIRQAEAATLLSSARVKQLSQILQQTRKELIQQDAYLKSRGTETIGLASSAGLSSIQTRERRELWDTLYAAFEDQFRGDSNEIRERLKYYLPFFQEASRTTDILDLGCGTGDWLDLLRDEGLQARGVEINAVMLEACRARQLDVVEGDMLDYLHGLPDSCMNVITAFHLIEHIPFETMFELLNEVRRVLRPGGLVMLETPSPENLVVAACNFYSDPTHHKPVYPHTLTFVLKNMGFTDVRLQFLHPVEGSPFTGNDRLEPLHMWFYGPRDYAVIAAKA